MTEETNDRALGRIEAKLDTALERLGEHSSWIKDHQKSDDDSFGEIKNDITKAKAVIWTIGGIGSLIFSVVEGLKWMFQRH